MDQLVGKTSTLFAATADLEVMRTILKPESPASENLSGQNQHFIHDDDEFYNDLGPVKVFGSGFKGIS